MVKTVNRYAVGDMEVHYFMDTDTKNLGMYLLPLGKEPLKWEEKHQETDSLVQLKLTGDTYLGGYAGGGTLRQGESAKKLQYREQEYKESEDFKEIITYLEDARGYEVRHYLRWYKGEDSVEVRTEFENKGKEPVTLEMLSSFSLGGLTPFVKGDGYDSLLVHRIRAVWSMEGRVDTQTVEDLQLEPSWGGHAIRCERFGQVGSMPVNHYFPFVSVEDKESGVLWGAQIAHNASWQMELFRKDDGLSVSGGLADREFGQWMKQVEAGEVFTAPKAILSVCEGGGLDRISQRLTEAGKKYFNRAPESEQTLPVIFNEYCTTWGCPSHENITGILDVLKGKGFSYFVIDCGWYKKEGIPWDIMMGDYDVSEELFPQGLLKTVEAIKSHGMKPGIWFEIDNVGSAAKAYEYKEHLLKRDGVTLTTTMRRFWDMTDPWVESYLSEKVIGTLKDYRFEYMKMDYNDSIGPGCDGAESLGEGLRKNMEASLAFIRKVKKECPGIILENCASGGHKLEPLMMSETSMASFSDAHECEEIPIIAANLHRVILPCQSQIWAVIRKEDSKKRIAYSIINTFLGRMCLSGDVVGLSEEKWQLIERGIAFYNKISPIIKDGFTYFYGTKISSYRHPKGWQGILRAGRDGTAYLVIHVFFEELKEIVIDLPKEYDIQEIYSEGKENIAINGKKICYEPTQDRKAVAVLLKASSV